MLLSTEGYKNGRSISTTFHVIKILRHFGIWNAMTWNAPVCTTILCSKKFTILRQWYAPVCTTMHQYALEKMQNDHSSVKIYKFTASCIIYEHSKNTKQLYDVARPAKNFKSRSTKSGSFYFSH
jgi:glycerol-3-phosphate acyltransferase PlsY